MLTLKEIIARDVRDVFLNTDEHGELITYYPNAGGPAREIAAVVNHNVDTRLAQLPAGDDRDLVEVTLARHYWDTTPDGIEMPERGDQMHRKQHGDPDAWRYIFTGRILESDESSWTLEFERVIA